MSESSDREISDLNRHLAQDGEDVELWRITAAGMTQIKTKVTARAFCRSMNYTAAELVGQVVQEQWLVIMSPSEIITAGWPGPWTPSATEPTMPETDRRVPIKGDKVVIKGRARNIEVPMPIYVDNELVRIELRTKG